jgi:hypothetical protein
LALPTTQGLASVDFEPAFQGSLAPWKKFAGHGNHNK